MSTSRLRVTVNGEPRDVVDGTTVADLLADLLDQRDGTPVGSAGDGTAVAVNDDVVPRGEWAGAVLVADDRIEVLDAVAGG
ncbi:MAG TPA: sulfur carrier protein ThiS [Pseudonocardia sp.]|jgi:sulfur carrier protein|nr:sulfur carrier protein ThiS [Pseudonocardia sp.]